MIFLRRIEWIYWSLVGFIVLVGVGMLFGHFKRLVVTDSTCQPVGFYQLLGTPFPLHDGELVEVEIPGPQDHPAVAEGLKYHWFPKSEPWIKNVVALPGQTVVLKRQGVRVDGRLLPNSHVDRWTPGHHHRIMHYPFGTYHLKQGQVWLYAPGNYAFDSSYYGPVSENNILGKVRPWWVIPGSQFWLKKGD